MRIERLRSPIAAALAAIAASCDWVSLAKHSTSYPTIGGSDAANVAVVDSLFAFTRADSGAVIHGAVVLPRSMVGRVDDLAVAGRLAFLLDALPPGRLTVVSLGTNAGDARVASSVDVPVGPFSGVSAAGGTVVVSGGTSELTAWRYDDTGALTGPYATGDFGRGQPDVLLSRDGTIAFVSTHYWGPYFGIDIVDLVPNERRELQLLAKLPLDGAGFTEGGAKPANFPIESALLGDSTLLVANERGLAIVDVADPRAPRLLRVMDVGGPAVSVDVHESVAAVAVAGGAPAVVLIDFAAAPEPAPRRVSLTPGTRPLGIALSRSHAAVAARDMSIVIIPK